MFAIPATATAADTASTIEYSGEKATDVLAELKTKGRASKTGYARTRFGAAWADVDHNGCDTRNDILQRDLTNVIYKPGTHNCIVKSGTLDDPYTGKTINFKRGNKTSSAVQIDHVVALSDAWQKGAKKLSKARRTQLANDPYNLLAVDGPANQQKSDGDAATWLPKNKSYRCNYVARQIGVKAKYSLWVTKAERKAMTKVLSSCPTQTVPEDDSLTGTDDKNATSTNATDTADTSGTGSANASNSSSAADSGNSTGSDTAATTPDTPSQNAEQSTQQNTQQDANVYYQNCAAVRAAGKAPLYQGQPGYSTKLDRDRDGVACE
ncbi:GmrSD restriction endonuclease domain-containing protein [Bifidobacterium goeldii]|nr:DUF1524 domain-containing protein [Bifidobacterium goeldii]